MFDTATIERFALWIREADEATLHAVVARQVDTDGELTDMLVRFASSELRKREAAC